MTKPTNEELIEKAYAAMKYAYAPYSKFCVGSAVMAEDYSVYTGCNVENASYGATICAERTAVSKAISEGHRKILKIAIVSGTRAYTYPCGICRQVLSEFMDEDGIVLLADNKKGICEYTLNELLPHHFEL